MSVFPALSFGAPWILAALAALPAIWWLLRVTPPAPRRVEFPPLRLLAGLAAKDETPAHTPLWLLALRLLAASLVIVALAQPKLGEGPPLPGRGPLVLFVDNGWTSAENWNMRHAAIVTALSAAASSGRPVAIVSTASPLQSFSLLSAGEAQRRAAEILPQPWLPDRTRAVTALEKAKLGAGPEILWLSDGLDYGDSTRIAEALARRGRLRIYADAPGKSVLMLRSLRNEADGFVAHLARSANAVAQEGDVAALGAQGEMLASAHFRFPPNIAESSAKIPLPLEIRNETARVTVENRDSAGTVQLLGSGSRRRAVEIVSARNAQDEQPLLSDTYYLQRALAPYADVQKGTIGDALSRNVAVIVLANIGTIAGADHDRVARFVEHGGLLVRFAGGRMTTNVDDLIPVKLRVGGRYLGGALAWAQPQHLATFPDASPFRGLSVPPEVTVSRQVLAEPSIELGERSWARLADGTPLVTGAPRGKGWIVLFHVTASPAWSNLPLSGLYVEMLKRLLDLAGGAQLAQLASDANAVFPPAMTLDGFGRLIRPPADVLPLRGSDIARTTPSPAHPPGLYGRGGAEIALNAGNDLLQLDPLRLAGYRVQGYSASTALDLEGPLLAFALMILLADTCIGLWLRGYLPSLRLAGRGAALLALVMLLPPLHAHADDTFDMKAALDTRLAYVKTGLPDVDAMSAAGLTGLGLVLKARTSYEPLDPVGVDLDRDDLSFFPLLYWPMDPREHDLSPRAISKIADYMRNGGTILFDTRDLTVGGARGPQSPGEQTLRRLLSKLDMPPLQPVPSDHVLTKTFYLIQDFPGRWTGGKVWVEALPPPDPDSGPARGGDGVSPVIIGSNDWAAAWAVDSQGRPLADVTPGGDEQREMAYRFGVNVVMYALTGNYKTDNVHAQALLERLGR
ncbi:MAG TPA: DUF4159 domain-containing protein [Rhizomicrobium sp.]|jgi:hypothetical protein|nr:DUF4159 domain-containing protein [Rhizomicrobium sp.]